MPEIQSPEFSEVRGPVVGDIWGQEKGRRQGSRRRI